MSKPDSYDICENCWECFGNHRHIDGACPTFFEDKKFKLWKNAKPLDALVIRQGEMVTNIVGILEDVKATYSGDRFIKERLEIAIKRAEGLRPIDIIKEALDEFNDAIIDILPEDFDGKKVNAVYDKVLKALSVKGR